MTPIRDNIELACGHLLRFGSCGEPGSGRELTHQKDPLMMRAYNDLLDGPLRGWIPRNVLEIGVCRGGSLALWQHLWASDVVGVDCALDQVTPTALEHFSEENQRIKTVSMTMPDWSLTQQGTFDLIIDDGGHGPDAVFPAFAVCWPMVNPGGYYIIEDWHQAFLDPQSLLWFAASHLIGNASVAEEPAEGPLKLIVYRAMIVLEKRGGK